MNRLIFISIIIIFSIIQCSAQAFTMNDTTFKVGDVMRTYEILFDLDRATLRPESLNYLDSVAIFLKKNKNLKIEVNVHRDERSESYPSAVLCMTCKRAQSVVDYLILKGISSDRLEAKGYGATKPLIKEAKTEEQHRKNRRTEFKITSIE